MPGTVLDVGDSALDKTDITPAFMKFLEKG